MQLEKGEREWTYITLGGGGGGGRGREWTYITLGGGGGGERMDIHYFAKLMYNMRHIQVAWR